MNQSLRTANPTKENTTSSDGRRVAFIQSSWHKEIVDRCRESFVTQLGKLGIDASGVDIFAVPGAFEIPLQAKLLAKSGRYSAIVCAGFVVNGGIYRHEFVAQAVISGLMQVQLETEVPVLSAVLTPHHFHEHDEHQKFYFDHFVVKGVEVANACAQTLTNIQQLKLVTA
nr:6,7-dimethyl-8-ribityllumazine synthase [uncultured Dongia sp.]